MKHRNLVAGLLTATITLSGIAATTTTAHAADRQRERYDVAITVSDEQPELGDRIKVKGFVGPAAPGQRVLLQVRYADQSTWKTVGRARLKPDSTYKFVTKVDTVRERAYRVVKPAVGRYDGRAVSQKEKVTVFAWRDLTSLDPVSFSGFYELTATLNGVTFPHSVFESTVAGPGAAHSIDYNINRDCTLLTGTAGLSDTSGVNGTSTVTISADGISRFSRSFALTQTAPVSLDLTDVFRLTVSASSVDGLGVLGTPQVYCSF